MSDHSLSCVLTTFVWYMETDRQWHEFRLKMGEGTGETDLLRWIPERTPQTALHNEVARNVVCLVRDVPPETIILPVFPIEYKT